MEKVKKEKCPQRRLEVGPFHITNTCSKFGLEGRIIEIMRATQKVGTRRHNAGKE